MVARSPLLPKGGSNTEQLNIEGKRSGEGFLCSRRVLTSALSRALAARLMIVGVEVGRAGFLSYLKALNGATVKVVPNGHNGASESQTADHKALKVICGNHQASIEAATWLTDKTPFQVLTIHVQPSPAIAPNIGAGELADALARVLPFTAKDDSRPVLACVYFEAKDGKLTLTSADGFALANLALDCQGIDGSVLVTAGELAGLVKALNLAKRARVGIEDGKLIVDTDAIRYALDTLEGHYPDYQKLIPSEFKARASFDSAEAVKAIVGVVASASKEKTFAVDLYTVPDKGAVIFHATDLHAEAEVPAVVDGQFHTRLDGRYLLAALKSCGGIVELAGTNSYSPVLFTVEGLRVVVMPMLTAQSAEDQKRDKATAEATAQPEAGTDQGTPVTDVQTVEQPPEPVTEQPSADKVKRKHARKVKAEAPPTPEPEAEPTPAEDREPVAVA